MAMPNTVRGKDMSVAAAAAEFLKRCWSVLPVRAHDKRPLIAWEPLQSARPSAGDLNDWFRRWPDANIGIVTGEISNLIVVDVDPKHGGEHSLERLQQRFGSLPSTVESETGGGGRHLYFAHPGIVCRNRAGLAQGIDLRGDGGYVVAPPSVHPSGRRYVWAFGRSPAEMSLAPLPRWLMAPGGVRVGRSLADWRRLAREGVTEGQRNSTLASLAGHLLWHGVDPAVTLELLLAWNRGRCRPPLDDAEVAQVVQNIVRLHDADGTDHIDRQREPDAPKVVVAERGPL
jgi:Bifunctional DNA primase/polymerase, N-terminal/Primase C terminal 1 (PriCT-1)